MRPLQLHDADAAARPRALPRGAQPTRGRSQRRGEHHPGEPRAVRPRGRRGLVRPATL